MNAGTRLQVLWRWNGKPLRIRITRERFDRHGVSDWHWQIRWERWFPRGRGLMDGPGWYEWRSYGGSGELRDIIARYRSYADGWRGFE